MSTPLLIQFLACPVVLVALLFMPAPYGRHHNKGKGWGSTLPNRMAWVLMEIPALVVIAWLVLASPARTSAVAVVPLTFWLFHYGYRTFVFPALMRPSDRTFPAILVLFAIVFNVLNGYNNAQPLIKSAADSVPLITAHFLIGSLIFIVGFVMHVHSDAVIRRLRDAGGRGYSIPHGGMFRWVGSPNYLGEIIQWTGWAIMTWSLAGVAFALFTACNLLPRAIANHRWYRAQFNSYPANRKVLIPGIY